MKMVNNQYEIAVDIDEYIFDRYVKNKCQRRISRLYILQSYKP